MPCYNHDRLVYGRIVNSSKDIVLRDMWAEQQRAAKELEEAEQEKSKAGFPPNEYGNGASTEMTMDQNQKNGLRRRGRASSNSGSVSISSNDDEIPVEDDRHKKRTTCHLDTTTAATTTTVPESEPTRPTTKKKKERNPDPLLWFGVFVPAPLRNAQNIFQKGNWFCPQHCDATEQGCPMIDIILLIPLSSSCLSLASMQLTCRTSIRVYCS